MSKLEILEAIQNKEVLTKKEASALLNVSSRTIDRYREKGILKGFSIGEVKQGNKIYFLKEDIAKLVNEI